MGLSAAKRRRYRNIVNFVARRGAKRNPWAASLEAGAPDGMVARENKRMIPTPDRSVLAPKKCNDLGERNH